jgi:anthranilate synthase component 1
MKLCAGQADSFLLESVETKEITGRYSIIAFDPIFGFQLNNVSVHRDRHKQSEERWGRLGGGDGLPLHPNRAQGRLKPGELLLNNDEGLFWNGSDSSVFPADQFFGRLKAKLDEIRLDPAPGVPSVGSLLGFVGYDAVRLMELLSRPNESTYPVSRLVFPSRFAIFDQISRKLTLTAIDQQRSICEQKIKEMREILSKPLIYKTCGGHMDLQAPPRDKYLAAIETAKERIRAGEIFQVVLSDAFTGEAEIDSFEVYRRLRVSSPSPYMFYLNLGEYTILGASPETLVKVRDGHVTVMPIAGTRGRSADPERDMELERELLGSEKETAEHLMLVDLARNDVGKVSEYGSINVAPYMTIQRYSHVMHLVSQVTGRLKPGSDIVDAFMAGFPAGTVSGAPKVRAMEIIDELESSLRGPYAGAVGYFGPNGRMDTCIAIRTILFRENRFSVRVGAGIVADSIPEMEYKEIQNKAAQSLHALETAARGAQ